MKPPHYLPPYLSIHLSIRIWLIELLQQLGSQTRHGWLGRLPSSVGSGLCTSKLIHSTSLWSRSLRVWVSWLVNQDNAMGGGLCPVPKKETDTFTIMGPSNALGDSRSDVNGDQFWAGPLPLFLRNSIGDLNQCSYWISRKKTKILERNIPPTAQLEDLLWDSS